MNNTKEKKRRPPSSTGGILILLFFFVVAPGIPILLALISEPSTTTPQMSGSCGTELTEEGKKLFAGKEELISQYVGAANKYNIPWEILAAIHQDASNFALSGEPMADDEITSGTETAKIKVGPLAMIEGNWVSQRDRLADFFAAYPAAKTEMSDLGDIKNSFHSTIIDPEVIKKHQGVGVDGDGDDKADPYNLVDALFTVAKQLKDGGITEGKIKEALTSYNSELGYAGKIEKSAQEIVSMVNVQNCGEQVPTGTIKLMIDEAYKQYRERTISYIFGADGYPVFDCSSWVKYMYKRHLGIQLPRVTYDQVEKGTFVPKDQLQPGDLIFFARGSDVYHVGMYVGDGMMIHNSNPEKDMKLDTIKSGYYATYYHSGRRYTKADSL